jgi:hypothetical protein
MAPEKRKYALLKPFDISRTIAAGNVASIR